MLKKLLQKWFPPKEKPVFTTLVFSQNNVSINIDIFKNGKKIGYCYIRLNEHCSEFEDNKKLLPVFKNAVELSLSHVH